MRLSRIVALFKTKGEACEVVGVSSEQMRSYEKGRAKIPFEAAVRLHIEKRIDLNWFATGQGSMTPSRSQSDAAVQARLAFDVTKTIDDLLAGEGGLWDEDRRRELWLLVYEDALANGGHLDPERVKRYIRLGAAKR